MDRGCSFVYIHKTSLTMAPLTHSSGQYRVKELPYLQGPLHNALSLFTLGVKEQLVEWGERELSQNQIQDN